MGQLLGVQAMNLAIEKARKVGVGMVTVRNSNHYGIAGYYTKMAADVKATAGYFLLGILLGTAFQRYVPQEDFVSLFGKNEGFGVLMAAAIGVPLYACGGGTIPLLRSWLAGGMSLGSAAAFMITGPATRITNLGALKSVLGFKRFVRYIVFAMALAFVTGLVTDIFL